MHGAHVRAIIWPCARDLDLATYINGLPLGATTTTQRLAPRRCTFALLGGWRRVLVLVLIFVQELHGLLLRQDARPITGPQRLGDEAICTLVLPRTCLTPVF